MAGLPVLINTGQSKATVDHITIASATVPAGASLYVAFVWDNGAAGFDSITWGGTSLTETVQGESLFGLTKSFVVLALHEVAAGTHDIVCTLDAVAQSLAAVAWYVLGNTQSPTDKTASPTQGASTTPSCGPTATTSQASETAIAVICTEGPVEDNAGTFSNSFTALGRGGTTGGLGVTNCTVAVGTKVLSATGAQTGAKTGITSRSWGAFVFTLKSAADVSISLGTPSLLATAPAMTTTPAAVSVALGTPTIATTAPAMTTSHGATSISLGTPTIAATAPALTVAQVVSLSLGTPSMALTAPALDTIETYMGTDANGIIDPSTPLSDGAASIAQSRGIRSFGLPYFAMWMQQPAGFVDMRYPIVASLLLSNGFTVIAAINSRPVQIVSVDEIHYFTSYHEVGGVELMSLGVTPDLRLALKMYDGPVLYSAPGIVLADGIARTYTFTIVQDSHTPGYRNRLLMIDDLIVAYDTRTGHPSYVDGIVSPTGKSTRVMIFNGVEARTLMDCTVFALRYRAALWPMTPIVGLGTPGYETTGGIGEPIAPNDPPYYPTADFTLTAGFFDPRPLNPALAGAFPSSSAGQSFDRVLNTQYRPRRIVTPEYRLAGSS